MAVISPASLTRLRQAAARAKGSGIDWTKGTINAAFQAIEDWLDGGEATRPAQSLSSALDAATAPHVFSAGEKRILLNLAYELRGR